MKKQHFILLLSSALLSISQVQAQTVQIGNMTSGVTASGNTISINNGANSLQIGGIPPLVQGAVTATKEALGSTGTTDTSKINAENIAKIDAAKNNFIKQKDEAAATAAAANNKTEVITNKTEQQSVRVGQDLNTLKANLVTDNIAFYNKTTINQIEAKAQEENPKMYSKFPEYMIKNY